jgi:hypothetical protein
MRIKAFKRFGEQPIVEKISAAVIEKDDGTPVAAVSEVAGGLCCFVTAEDPEFHRVLEMLGMKRIVVVDSIDDFLPASKLRQSPIVVGGK